jgi:peptidoglycan/LPS O-acetylase OafA/YrhL
MSVHAALARPIGRSRGRHAKPRPAWPRVAVRALFLFSALIAAVVDLGAGWPPVLLVVPAVVLLLFVASVAKLRTAARKIDTIFAEELAERDEVPEAAERIAS